MMSLGFESGIYTGKKFKVLIIFKQHCFIIIKLNRILSVDR